VQYLVNIQCISSIVAHYQSLQATSCNLFVSVQLLYSLCRLSVNYYHHHHHHHCTFSFSALTLILMARWENLCHLSTKGSVLGKCK